MEQASGPMFSAASLPMRDSRMATIWLMCLLLLAFLRAGNGSPGPEQVSQLRARHTGGQTLLTWQEVQPPVTQELLSVADLVKIRANLDQEKRVRYLIYRSKQPIRSVKGLKPLAEVAPLTGWNADYYGIPPKPTDWALRYVVEEGQPPVPPGTGIYAHNPEEGGDAYYAVTVSINGRENVTTTQENALQSPVQETVGRGVPFLQRITKPKLFQYIENPTLYYYVRWESPPNANIPSKPFDYLVAIPPQVAKPAPVGIHFHSWGGSLNGGYGWWYNAEKGAILIASNQIPYDWWTGYHELLGTGQPLTSKADWEKGAVRAYSQRRMLSFLDWVATKWDVDLNRTFAAGSSMGGSGASKLAIRFPGRIAWAISWVGVHIPRQAPQFVESYGAVYGAPEWGVAFENGTPAWDYFDDASYLRLYPQKEIGFITFSNGKNDGGIGWPQAVEFFRALQETKRPHLFIWGQDGHGQRASMPQAGGERVMPIDIRVNQSLPAFTRCSLDDNPGSGEPKDGDPAGQINLYLYWETKNIVDTPERWEMTVGLIDTAPKAVSTVDVTPRRLQAFSVSPGARLKWTNTSLQDRRVIQSGEAVADKWGLITLQNVVVSKAKNRLKLSQ
jgi:pimeloyl-ACP methyl ester carboxylesterase